MNRVYFSKNVFTHEYFLDRGCFGEKHRIYLGKEVILKDLKKYINLNKETYLYIDKTINEEQVKGLEKLFNASKKINLKVVDDLRDVSC